jgi:hypothetical protein
MQTMNQIEVALPQEKVVELYTCHDLLPAWSPGFVSLEVLHEGTLGRLPTFKQRYTAMGRDIEEILTLVENDLPSGFVVVAENGGTLTRESRVTFERLADRATQIKVLNTYSGEWVVHLVQEDLHSYTQQFLESFRVFAESK